MKKLIAMILSAFMILSLAGCAATAPTTMSAETETKATTQETKESAPDKTDDTTAASSEESSETTEPQGGKILVVYFSWSGNLHKMAGWIADETGADIVRIEAKDPYPSDYKKTADRAKKEQDDGVRPEITVNIADLNLAQYDTVFIGFPVWWYDLPMSMWTFLEGADLSGKTLIPFFSHEGSSNGAGSLDTIARLAPGADFKRDNYLSIRGGKVDKSEQDVRNWVKDLGYSK
ncbi:MAG: hypothetical protein IKZ42_06240 [Clostridiales bacterium]|nr:hypothetical protein [Clostridiales bacterium]